jgi:hypothetical protein
MVIAFKCFLFPSSSELPNTDYLSILQDPESTSSVDLCMLVFEHFISGVHRYNRTCKLIGRKGKCFEFSNYILAVSYKLFLSVFATISGFAFLKMMGYFYEMYFAGLLSRFFGFWTYYS